MKDALKELVDRHLPSPSHMDVVASRERILDRLRSKPAHLQTPRVADAEPSIPVSNVARWRSAILIPAAAALVLAAAVAGAILWPRGEGVSSGVSYRVVDGTVEQVDAIQTDDDGATLALTDGSRVEMRSHSELSLDRMPDGLAIRLRAGDIIVNAAKQRTGHLYVYTKDMTVSVVGTVFFVSAADEGSRVGVIEGEVRVREGATETSLRPGDQISTSLTHETRTVKDEIAWSRNVKRHLSLLAVSVSVIAQQAPTPTPPPPAGGTTPQNTGVTATPPPSGRGGDPNAAIGAPSSIGILTPPPPPLVGAGAISGIVTDASTGAPLEGARVSILGGFAPNQAMNRPGQTTDSKGRFIFTNLPPSPPSTEYTLAASRPGYLGGYYRQVPGVSARDSVRLADGQWFREGNIKLWRPGAISGTVRDERGEPFVGIPIRMLVGATVAGRLRWASGPVTRTDDRGMYRFPGLSKGRYLVHVPSIQVSLAAGEVALYRPPVSGNTAGAAAPNRTRDVLHVVRGPDGSGVIAGLFANAPPDDKGSVYASVFNPAARSIDQAEPIGLEFGEDRNDVDIQMMPVPSASVSGTLAGPPDAVAGIPVRIILTGNELLGQAGDAGLAKTDAIGQFTFHRIPAGDYVIVASRSVDDFEIVGYGLQPPLLPIGANAFAWSTGSSVRNGVQIDRRLTREADVTGRLQVSVGNRALSGLVVQVTPSVSVSGHFEWDGSETPPAAVSQSLVLVELEPADGNPTLGYSGARAMTNAATRSMFTLGDVKPGRYVFGEIRGAAGFAYRLVGATWNGRDIINTPLEVSGEGPVTGVVLRMSSQINKVTGTVRAADGRTATEGAVIAFPTSPSALLESGLSAIRFQTATVAADGTYALPPMIPGDYLLAAISMEDRARWLEPEFLASISRLATRVSLGLASTLSQDLRVVNISGGGR